MLPTLESINTIIYFANLVLLALNIFLLILVGLKRSSLQTQEQRITKIYPNDLEQAQKKALEILQDATEKSKTIINNTETVSEETRTQLEQHINELLTHRAKLTDDAFNSFHEETSSFFQKLQSDARQKTEKSVAQASSMASEEIEAYIEEVKKHTIKLQQNTDEKIAQGLQSARDEINQYKSDKMEAIRQSFEDIVYDALTTILPEELEITLQEKIVDEALKKAQKDGWDI